ncbi:MBL fold metallo-hydrolase [Elioraea thermophila]|uniref:MBL fold metallo-hydrolase n=1 Tax=Elioraea thermophila TaxID=2185104 RepID=UPI000DF3AD61|nr:MBL fold metallo-hydrolase [Elioraea thermophila]
MRPTFLSEPPPAYGVPFEVAPGIRRIVARNPSPYTYHGTNTWLVGRGAVAIIDPGPDDADHRDAILAAVAGERVTHIVVTHHHRDHAPGAAALARALEAPVAAWGGPRPATATTPLPAPDLPLAEGDAIEGPDWRLLALHTPGHASDHLCFALEGRGILFSGDHVMGWSSSVVIPPDGDMAAYMANLARLLARDETLYLCGHGPVLPEPHALVRALLAHREAREAQILEAVAAGADRIDVLLDRLYPGLDDRLLWAARRTLEAHLAKLEAEGRLAPGRIAR